MTHLDRVTAEAHKKTGLTGADLRKFVCLFLADVALQQGKHGKAKDVLDVAARQ